MARGGSLECPELAQASRGSRLERLQELEAERLRLARELEEQRALRAVLLSFHQPEALEAERTVRLTWPIAQSELTFKVRQNSSLAHAGLLWQSGVALANYIVHQRDKILSRLAPRWPRDSAPLRVVELGAGVAALPALAAACAFGGQVVATDIAAVIHAMEENIRANLPALVLPEATTLTAEAFTWCDGCPPNMPADLLLGADLFYDEAVHESLAAATRSALEVSGAGALAIFAYKERDPTSESAFVQLLQSQGCAATEVEVVDADPGTQGHVRILEVRLHDKPAVASTNADGAEPMLEGLYL